MSQNSNERFSRNVRDEALKSFPGIRNGIESGAMQPVNGRLGVNEISEEALKTPPGKNEVSMEG